MNCTGCFDIKVKAGAEVKVAGDELKVFHVDSRNGGKFFF